jgi:hypothetical protein
LALHVDRDADHRIRFTNRSGRFLADLNLFDRWKRLSVVLIIKDMRSSAAHSVLRGLGLVFTILLLIPVIAVGVLFIGCMGCH